MFQHGQRRRVSVGNHSPSTPRWSPRVWIDESHSLTGARRKQKNTSSRRQQHLIPFLFFLSSCPLSISEKCQENNKCTKGQRRTNRPFQAFITFAVGYCRGARAAALTFGLFLHRVESHMAAAPNNVGRERSLGAACWGFLPLCSGANTQLSSRNQINDPADTSAWSLAASLVDGDDDVDEGGMKSIILLNHHQYSFCYLNWQICCFIL